MKSILRQMRIKFISGRVFFSFSFFFFVSFTFIAILHNATMGMAIFFSVPHAINTAYRYTCDYKLFLHWFFNNNGICWVFLMYTHGIFITSFLEIKNSSISIWMHTIPFFPLNAWAKLFAVHFGQMALNGHS